MRWAVLNPYAIVFVVSFAVAGALTVYCARDRLVEAWAGYCGKLGRHFDRLFIQADPRVVARQIVLGGLALAVVLAAGAGRYAGLTALALLAVTPDLVLKRRGQGRLAKFELQLPDALRTVANGLKAGLVLTRAIRLVEDNMAAPVSQELGLVLRRYQLGTTIDEALSAMGERLRSPTLDLALTALQVGRRSGGDLARVLESTAAAIEQIQRLEAKIQIATSQGKLQAWVVSAMPPVFAVMVYYIDPTLILPLFQDPLGWCVLAAIGTLELVGVFFLRKIISVQV